MKTRLLIVILSLIVIALIAVYILIPSPLTVSGTTSFHASSNGSYRTLTRQDAWNKFASGKFILSKRLTNAVELTVQNAGKKYPVSILIVPKSADSTIILWRSQFPLTYNPFSRIAQYSQATSLHRAVNDAFDQFQSYVAKVENVYGSPIIETSTKDTFLIATRFTTTSFPSLNTIYGNIDKLKSYAKNVGADIVSSPMLNVSTNDSINYNSMVAVPINKIVDGTGNIFFVRMVPGRFLTTEVKGGPARISGAHKMMDQYFKDYNRVSMAIPFEYLVTDRQKEPDTSKWITKIYCPVY